MLGLDWKWHFLNSFCITFIFAYKHDSSLFIDVYNKSSNYLLYLISKKKMGKHYFSACHNVALKFTIQLEWGWTAQNSIARQSFARHFWQEINCSTQNLSTARIQLILAKLDSSKWQKSVNCSTVSSSWDSIFGDSKK